MRCGLIIYYNKGPGLQSGCNFLHDNTVILLWYSVCKDNSKKGGGPEGTAGERGGGASPYDSRPVGNREVDASDGYPFETTPAFPQIKR